MKKLLLFIIMILACISITCFSGCGNGQVNYYNVKEFLKLNSSEIIKSLEQSGFEYDENAYTLGGVSGTKCDWVAMKDDILGDYQGTEINFTNKSTGSLSKADMEHGNASVGRMSIDLIGGSRVSDSTAPIIADEIMKKCGLSDSEYKEGKNLVDEWYREGITTINGKDARWQIFVVNDSSVNYISLDIDLENTGLLTDLLEKYK